RPIRVTPDRIVRVRELGRHEAHVGEVQPIGARAADGLVEVDQGVEIQVRDRVAHHHFRLVPTGGRGFAKAADSVDRSLETVLPATNHVVELGWTVDADYQTRGTRRGEIVGALRQRVPAARDRGLGLPLRAVRDAPG